MKRINSSIFTDWCIIELEKFEDDRGFFCESYNKEKFSKLGINYDFVQDNHSKSCKNVIRGLHFQSTPGQAKLVRCTKGIIWDVAVDMRPNSPTFKSYASILLENNYTMVMIPPGFAHGFSVLTDEAEVQYKCSSLYNPKTECGFKYNDPDIGIDWKIDNPIVSDRDLKNLSFKEICKELGI